MENNPPFFAADRVLNVESSATTITVLGKIQHLPDSCVVHKLLLGQERPAQDVGADGEPAVVLVGALVPLAPLLVCRVLKLADDKACFTSTRSFRG